MRVKSRKRQDLPGITEQVSGRAGPQTAGSTSCLGLRFSKTRPVDTLSVIEVYKGEWRERHAERMNK